MRMRGELVEVRMEEEEEMVIFIVTLYHSGEKLENRTRAMSFCNLYAL
jgi:hypothetical protein